MIRRPPRSTRTDTLFPSTTLFRSGAGEIADHRVPAEHGLERLGFEPLVEHLASGLGEQVEQVAAAAHVQVLPLLGPRQRGQPEIGKASWRERVCQYV